MYGAMQNLPSIIFLHSTFKLQSPKAEKIPKVSLLIPLTAFFFKRTRVLVFYKLIVLGKSEISKNIAVLWSFFTKVASCGPA